MLPTAHKMNAAAARQAQEQAAAARQAQAAAKKAAAAQAAAARKAAAAQAAATRQATAQAKAATNRAAAAQRYALHHPHPVIAAASDNGSTSPAATTAATSDPYANFGATAGMSPPVDASSIDSGSTSTSSPASGGLSTGEKIGLVIAGIAGVGALYLYAKYRAVTAPIRHVHRIIKAGRGLAAAVKG